MQVAGHIDLNQVPFHLNQVSCHLNQVPFHLKRKRLRDINICRTLLVLTRLNNYVLYGLCVGSEKP